MIDDEIVSFEHPVVSSLRVNAEVIKHLTNMDCYEDLFPLMVERINAHSEFILETSKQISATTKLHLKRVK